MTLIFYIVISFGVLLPTATYAQTIYKWIDKQGITHYSDKKHNSSTTTIKTVTPTKSKVMGSSVLENFMEMSKVEKDKQLSNILSYRGISCGSAQSFYMGRDKEKTAYWSVKCEGSSSYIVAIYNNSLGSTRVISCSLANKLNIKCFQRFND